MTQWDRSQDQPEPLIQPRPVTLVEAGRSRPLNLRIEVPVEDMTNLAGRAETGGSPLGNDVADAAEQETPFAGNPAVTDIPSIWPAIHPRLIELIDSHRSTMIFVNSRRLAERLATSLNQTADRELALAHHGSIAKATRQQIEDRLKQGDLPAIVATSSLELGIDMGAVDLVVQIEAPPSIASGIQRIGRASHQVGGTSSGVVFPKFRGDLLACSAAAKRMLEGEVEETLFPRNPLDVLAQQIVAIVSQGPIDADQLYGWVRQAASFFELPRTSYESVLDMLTGRYPSEEFSELRPRLNWDRISQTLSPRRNTQRLAVVNAGTIPDRGLYGVFLDSDEGGGSRVGELDEEMVFETRPGEVFLLGASSWRVTDITSDKVLVVPAPGEPGRMPFWRGDGPGRPFEFGVAIGQLTRRLLRLERSQAEHALRTEHCLDQLAAKNLVDYLHDQQAATEFVPDDQTIVVEMFPDEVGDWRVAVLSPFGARVHAPWATAITARLRNEISDEVDMVWSDDGMVFRLPGSTQLGDLAHLFPAPDEIESMVVDELGSTALVAGRFRENAARALLLPRRQPGRRTPLWLQRRKSANLLTVAAKYPSFPIILETYRECLRDVFDSSQPEVDPTVVQQQSIRIHQVEHDAPSPFASSLLFDYTGNFIYNGDTPLAERRAQSLALDHTQLTELLGGSEMRELLKPEAVDQIQMELQCLDTRYGARDKDGLHDLLRRLGDLAGEELGARVHDVDTLTVDRWLVELQQERRILQVRVAGIDRYIAVEDAGRYRDGLGVVIPPGVPSVFLEPVSDAKLELVARFARTHVAFRLDQLVDRLGIATLDAQAALDSLTQDGRVLSGEFLPGGRGREWCASDVLRRMKRLSLAQWRQQIEPVDPSALARFLPQWQCVARPRRGLDGLLDTIEQLQGMPIAASSLDQAILPARVSDYQLSDLDQLCSAGEIIWRGCSRVGADDGKIALYLTDHFTQLAPDPEPVDCPMADKILALLNERGALFFDQIVSELREFRPDVTNSLWILVWAGWLTSDTLGPLRRRRKPNRNARRSVSARGSVAPSLRSFRSRRATQSQEGVEGRWSVLPNVERANRPDNTTRQLALANQLIERYGVVTRETVLSEDIQGGFSGLYPVLKSMEEAGKLRRGYFVAGLGAAQFAAPGAEDRLRNPDPPESPASHSSAPIHPGWRTLAACDPANPYGATLPWPKNSITNVRPQRVPGARVLLRNGQLLGYLGRTSSNLLTFLPDDTIEAEQDAKGLACYLTTLAENTPLLLNKIDGNSPADSPLKSALLDAGFKPTSRGLHCRSAAADAR